MARRRSTKRSRTLRRDWTSTAACRGTGRPGTGPKSTRPCGNPDRPAQTPRQRSGAMSSTRSSNDLRTPPALKVAHPTVAERTARGRECAKRSASHTPGRVCAGARAPGSGCVARGPGRKPCPGVGADSLWADACLAVCFVSRRCPGDGERPRDDAVDRHSHPAVRGCASVELWCLRHTRAPAAVRCQRFRRDRTRTMGVGPQAAGGEPRGGGPREWVCTGADRSGSSWRAHSSTAPQ